MATISQTDRRETTTVVVSVRIPNGADGDLATETERRLARAAGVSDVIVEELRGLEPELSATVVTAAVTIETAGEQTRRELRDRLAKRSFVEGIPDRHE